MMAQEKSQYPRSRAGAVARHRTSILPAALLAIALLALNAAPASAKKTHLVLEELGGSAHPTVVHDSGSLAVDQSDGDLLALSTGADIKGYVSRFKPNGEPDPFSALGTNVIDAELGPGGKPCAEEPASCDQTPQNGFELGSGSAGDTQVAVDSSCALHEPPLSGIACESFDPADGNIYVTEGGGTFDSPGHHVVDVFASTGAYLGQLTGAGSTTFSGPQGVAVGGEGTLYVGDVSVYKFVPTANPPSNSDGTVLSTIPQAEGVSNLVTGSGSSAGALFGVRLDFSEHASDTIRKINPANGALEGFIDPTGGPYRVLAVDPRSGHLFALGAVNGFEPEKYSSLGREFTASGTLVSSFEGVGRGVAVDGTTGNIYVSANFRQGITVFGPLVTIPAAATGSGEVTGDTSVRVTGTVNPEGTALEDCFFEYGPTAKYGQTAPCEAPDAAEVGSGTGAVEVHADLAGLATEASYHYRLVADNHNHVLYPEDENAVVKGADQAFHTPSKPELKGLWAANVVTVDATLKATLNPGNSPTTYHFEWGADSSYGHSSPTVELGSDDADHTVSFSLAGLDPATTYHYRLVAANGIGTTEGSDHHFTTFAVPAPPPAACPANESFRGGASSLLPDCRAYELVSPVDKEGGDVRVLPTSLQTSAVLEQAADAGDKLAYGSTRSFAGSLAAPYTSQYIARRIEGSGWQSHPVNPPRGAPLYGGFTGQTMSELKALSPDLCQGWYITLAESRWAPPPALPGYSDLFLRTDRLCGAEGYQALAPVFTPPVAKAEEFAMGFEGASPRGDHALFTSNRKLTEEGTEGASQVYEVAPGGLPRLVCILPDGTPFAGNCTAGSGEGDAELTTSLAGAISADGRRVFWSTAFNTGVEGKIYLRIDGATTVAVSLAAEAEAGSSGSWFLGASTEGERVAFTTGGRLYEADVEGETVTTSPPLATGVTGVMGVSADARDVYFLSTAALTGESPGEANGEGAFAREGEPNLYLHEDGAGTGTTTFVATLAADDVRGATARAPYIRSSRVTPDGAHAAFVSVAPLTVYDNHDAATGEAAREVYRYDADTETLTCASCNPSGARPQTIALEGGRVAGSIPKFEDSLHAARVLSADGSRLYFDSADALVARDTDGSVDVYQWEEAGAGTCTTSSSTYSSQDEGCVDLVSSGQSPEDSEFVESDPSGKNVFFATASGLVPQDPGSYDIYDAREGGGLPIPGRAPACEGEACQGPASPPNDATPASSSFRGPGNVKEAVAKRCPKGKRKVRRGGKSRCVKRHRHHRKHHRRHHHRKHRADRNRRAGR